VAGVCTICTHPELEAIDSCVVGGVPYRTIAERHKPVSISAISRHRRDHLSPSLVALSTATGTETTGHDGTPLQRQLHGLYLRALGILDAAEKDGRPATALSAIREARGLLETAARVSGELDERPVVVNLHQSPEWQALQVRIIMALEPFPDARYAVAAAIARPAPELVS
jgi:hypothetical protein